MSQTVYLDYASASPLDPRVLSAMQPYFTDNFFNPSAAYESARKVKAAIEQARNQVASIIGAKANEIVFTAGGTEANNLAIAGVMAAHPKSNMVISAIEHPSIYEPAKDFSHKICPVDKDGRIKLNELAKLIDYQTVLLSIIYVSNEIGTIEPLKDAASLVSDIRKERLKRGISLPLYLHTDACQAANYLDLHPSKLGVDLMTINGGKIYGPKQSGLLFVKSGTQLKPIIKGGAQERDLRSGTENVPGIMGLAEALSIAQSNRKVSSEQTAVLQHYFMDQLKSLSPKITINGSLSHRVANNVHATLKGIDNEWLLIKLDQHGIMAAAGSACSASAQEASAVLKAIGLSDAEARNSIRFSLGRQSTKKDIDYTLKVLKKLMIETAI